MGLSERPVGCWKQGIADPGPSSSGLLVPSKEVNGKRFRSIVPASSDVSRAIRPADH